MDAAPEERVEALWREIEDLEVERYLGDREGRDTWDLTWRISELMVEVGRLEREIERKEILRVARHEVDIARIGDAP